ncbi:MAG: YhdH/YhfP family quinone oxidoreductase [Desulfopila sp.]|nr:YhdH/YhfP family quinone oxidoreductase [Desulfopila sp.]
MKPRNEIFKALVVEETPAGEFELNIKKKAIKDLPAGDVLIRVRYSSLNYKDALSASGNRGVTKKYPHTPGIDAAGEVVECDNEVFKAGEQVLVTGYDLGMNTCGGFEQYIRVPAEWVVKLPQGLRLGEAMIYGTAGFTAALSVHALTQDVSPRDGEILVTGASGGVGCLAVSLLARLGYKVVGVTGKPEGKRFLKKLGAIRTIDREEACDVSGRPMLKASWAGVIDTVGGDILATAIKSTMPFGVVTCCGNVASPDLPLTVFPFILRGVKLIGIDSQNCPMSLRQKIWDLLGDAWKIENLFDLCEEIGLEGLDHHIDLILQGKQKGRVVVNLDV